MVKLARIQPFLLAIPFRKMKKDKNAKSANNTKSVNNTNQVNKNIFIESINMETQTIYHNNGSINIYPCDFELGQHIVAGGKRVASQKGRMTTDDDGRSHFHPYAVNSGSRYMRLFDTHHGELKASKSSIIFRFAFPKKFGKELIEQLVGEEMDLMKAYLQTRRTQTQW